MKRASSKTQEKSGTSGMDAGPPVLTELFEHWSSHPQSLASQCRWCFAFGLAPIAFVALMLIGLSGWRMVVTRPTLFFWIVGGAGALSLGLVLSFSMLYLVARTRLAAKTDDPDRLPFPTALVVLFSFFWIVPVALFFAQVKWGVRIVPQQMMFVLNALCFAPFVLLLLWVRFAGGSESEKETVRRPIWFVLGTLLLGLAGLSVVGDLQVLVKGLRLPPPLSGLSKLALRAVALSSLLPLSMVCYAIWSLFRRSMTKEEREERKRNTKKSVWRRLKELLCGLFGKKETAGSGSEDPGAPAWLLQLCAKLPEGIRIATRKPPSPDLLPLPGTPMSDVSTSEEADPFWMLMGGREDRRPTELQFHFFERFRKSVDEARLARAKGNEVSPDIILAGDEGSGRTEALLAAAMYAAFARRQRVLFLVSDPGQAATLCAKAQRRFENIFLDCFLRADILEGGKAEAWVARIRARDSEGSDSVGSAGDVAYRVPPNILFATPRDVERVFFEGRVADADASAIDPLRALIRLFEVVLVDDFMELDVVERAHLPFLLHKLRMILVSGNLRPQFVVVTPRLRGKEGLNIVADRLFGFDFNRAEGDEGNAITLLPRRCDPAWSLPLVVEDGQNLGKVGEDLVRICLKLATDSGTPLRVVLYRKGLYPDQCKSLRARIAPTDDLARYLQVVSRLDEIERNGGADAVFYLTALSGRADMALRLSVGNEKTVYVSLSSESEAVFGRDESLGILPAVPDSTAVALRIHHLRSLLRFVIPGQPVDVSAWERFGIFLSERLRVADVRKDAMLHEKWRQDEWNELVYGNCPLWPYVAFESKWSVKSNAGKGTDFNVLPCTDEDVVQLGDDPMIGLVRPRTKLNGTDKAAGIGAGALAKWLDDQSVERGFVDLSHAETLVLGRSAIGEAYSTASCPVATVFTVANFEPRKSGDESCICRLRMKAWNGDGMDFDTPIRSLSWTIEPVSVPGPGLSDPGRTFRFFDLPDCQNLPRTVTGVITGWVNRIGQDVPEGADRLVRSYSYPAYFAGMLLVPRKFGRDDGSALIQRSVVGSWNTEDGSFSVVLTHLLTGVLRRIVPDLPFYAVVPVFHQRGKDTAVAAAVAWIVQPLNSGRTVDGIVRDLLLEPRCQAAVQKSLREVRAIFESCPGAKARLRWLRSFSRSAFTFDLEEPGKEEAFERDVAWSLEVLDVIDRRISGVLAEIEEFKKPVPGIVRDHSWMSRPRTFDFEGLQPDSVWNGRTEFPPPPEVGRPGVSCDWHYGGRKFSLSMGFSGTGDGERYNGFLDRSFPARVWGRCYTEYGFNDPYREFVGDLSSELRRMAVRAFPGATNTQLAEFLLAFVQESLPYEDDPDDKDSDSDWPRHPSETLMRRGGDCEDSSILYAELLRRFGIEGAMLSVPEHAAVGVNVPLPRTSDHQEPIAYTWLGKTYVYAETACSESLHPLGAKSGIIRSAADMPAEIIPTPALAEDASTPVRILNVIGLDKESMEITLVAPMGTSVPLAVVIFARSGQDVFAAPDPDTYPCIGGAKLPVLSPRRVVSASVKFAGSGFIPSWYDVFVCEPDGTVRGHFVGVGPGGLGNHAGYDTRIPCAAYRDHVLFRAKDLGNVKRCRGKVHLRVFFVDDAESRWDDCARAAYRRVVDDVVRTLEKNGSDETGLEMTWSDENRTMDGAFSVGKAAHDAIPALLGVSGVSGVTKAQNEFKKSRGCDEAPMVFVWNRDFRSSAQQSESGSSRLRAEWATLAMEDDIVGNPHAAWHALLHELLHIFGAEDLYYPDTVKKAAEKWLPGSVMNDGDAIDDLTRVLIGWDESLSPAAVSFLDATRGVTKKEIEDAMKAEWKKKWH